MVWGGAHIGKCKFVVVDIANKRLGAIVEPIAC